MLKANRLRELFPDVSLQNAKAENNSQNCHFAVVIVLEGVHVIVK